ncbi:oxidoreductase [Mycobacterium intermedium]|uniref:Oxidoreductase n=1 Tax=Mycobacterium intermedium TaxID=28445 RepID=A0A1E3SDK7_MYCIE|nr:NAD(P)-dependent oxidoreductase [Mycobacterium intermedium]MCV6963966.1 NAD(P)-dependent oxidoreductase [Mycobacterium intermedium]ODR00219.1 oxidoreductase [Mycobacterium intermedium]ORB07847.1 oxidoreductase [Mycobacterium intermedium]
MTDAATPRLGYIGLGNIGTPMAKRMAEWPGGLTVYDVRPEAMAPFAERGATLADSIADIAATDIISITVLNDEQVRNVVGELASHAKPGAIIAIHSTISDTTAEELARELQPQDIHVIDAPISGGGRAARFGQLATMVGASDEVFARVKEPFSHWAELVVHAGPPGAGTRMKVARNMLTFTTYAAVGEAWKLAEAAGLNLQDLGNVVRHTDKLTGGAGSIMYRDDTKDLEPGHFLYDGFTHTRELGEKDLRLALALAESASIDLPLARLALERLAPNLGVPRADSGQKEQEDS